MDKDPDISNEQFHSKKRHLIIMTEAGKPVYSRYGDEAELSPIVATINVIVNKLRNLKGDGEQVSVRRIETNITKTLIFHKHNLFLIYITRVKSDNDFLVQQLADSIFHQVAVCKEIIFSITNSFAERLAKNPSTNPGQNLESYHQTLSWTFGAGLNSYSGLFKAWMPFPVNVALRKKIKDTMNLFKSDGIM
jgi:hypothetical protein